MTETYDKLNHWYGWNGGECPVQEDWSVSIVTEDEVCNGPAGDFSWGHDWENGDILAFSITNMRAAPKVIWVNEYEDTHFAYSKKDQAENSADMSATRIAVPYVEQAQ